MIPEFQKRMAGNRATSVGSFPDGSIPVCIGLMASKLDPQAVECVAGFISERDARLAGKPKS